RFPAWDEMAFENFLCFAQRCFRQKRKKLLNNLAGAHPRERIRGALEALGISPSVRAEQLTIEDLAAIFSALK
ncbi:MAG: hypothetical protein KGM47_15210, partial [Acidobacteriota bacterium]|nr:hypothetical protein [Acidobacteriota bacterium]